MMSSRSARLSRRALVVPVCAGTLLVGSALPAAAHVHVSSPDAQPGEDGTLVFRVPTESATASTTRLQVSLPVDRPFPSVSVKPLTGWTVQTTERKLTKPVTDDGFTLTKAVSTVTWTARAGQGIRPGEYDDFELSVGPFPKGVSSVTMPTVQTYSDGSVVHWDQPSRPGEAEPEHPAPTLDLTATHLPAAADGSAGASPATTTMPAAAGSGASSSDGLARWLGGAGLVLGLAAVALALSPRARRGANP